MTLLEQTYRQLHSAGLVHSTAGFSRQYLGRNRNWYAWQKHAGRDMGAAAAVQCLRSIRTQLQAPSVNSTQRSALTAVETVLLEHLQERYAVADVCA
jgi:hypothetical protein